MELLSSYELSTHNTLALPSRAQYFCRVEHHEEFLEALEFARQRKLPLTVLGGGSNVVLRAHVPGLVIQMALRGISTSEEGGAIHLRAAAGEPWHPLVLHTLNLGYFGLENLSLIPGLAGAAPIQNIGAYGLEIADRIVSVEVVDIASAQTLILKREDCEFSYRNSLFKRNPGCFVVTGINLRLHRHAELIVDYPALAQALDQREFEELSPQLVSKTICEIRRRRLPDPQYHPNVGSFFKNPLIAAGHWAQLSRSWPQMPGYPQADGRVKLPAAWLIDQGGWRGRTRGGCSVHAEHALVLVNRGANDARHVLALADAIAADVCNRYGIELEPEPIIIGRDALTQP